MSGLELTITDRDGETRKVAAKTGDVLMQVLRDHVDITLGTCGGAISCGTCRVRLSPEWLASLPAPGEFEAEMLEALGAEADSRLSCQIILDAAADGMAVTIAPAE